MSEQSRPALPRWRAVAAVVAPYLAAAAISSLAAIPLLGLHGANLRVPFDYGGDVPLYAAVIKSVVEHGWFWTNPSVGAPGVFQAYDYPNVAHESLHLLVIKLMSAFSHDWVLLLNLYFLSGFPVITLSGMFTLRRLGVGTGPALVAAVLYSFLPTRLLKGEGHLFLDVFFQVPLAILLLLWVCGADPPDMWALVRRGARRARACAALAICVLNACTSAYFSFFAICLLMAGGAWASYERRSARHIISGLALSGIIVAAMAANGLPSIVYHMQHGKNGDVARREPLEAEVFGLKIAQLLLPVDGHRVAALRRLKHRYAVTAPLNAGENGTISLGLVGGVGFLALLGAVVVRRRVPPPLSPPAPEPADLVPSLAVLNLSAVLLGTIGGGGSLLALLVYPQIRSYSRLAVFIGFFALLAVALWLDRVRARYPRAALVVVPLVLALGLLDQASLAAARPYAQVERAFASDRDLVHAIERRLPAGSAVFVLPYVSFPESLPVNKKLFSNDELRGYLHSTKLRWSFPTMRGRNGDLFVRNAAGRPIPEMLRVLALADFNGILVHRAGYADEGAAIESELSAALATSPQVSARGDLAFFDLSDYRRHAATPAREVVAHLLHPIAATYDPGFYGQEARPDNAFNWCRARGEIHLENDLPVTRHISLSAVLVAATAPARLEISGDLIKTTVALDGPLEFARELDIPPGNHVLRFSCNGRPEQSADPRTLVWRIERLSIQDVPPPSAPPPDSPSR